MGLSSEKVKSKNSNSNSSRSSNSESNALRLDEFYATLNSDRLGNAGKSAFSSVSDTANFFAHSDEVSIAHLSDRDIFSFVVFCDNFFKIFPTENYALYSHYKYHRLGEYYSRFYPTIRTDNINDDNSLMNFYIAVFKALGLDKELAKDRKDKDFLAHLLQLITSHDKVFSIASSTEPQRDLDYTLNKNEHKKQKIVYSDSIPDCRVFYEDTLLRFLSFLTEHYRITQERMIELGIEGSVFKSDNFSMTSLELYASTYGISDGSHLTVSGSYLEEEQQLFAHTVICKKFSHIIKAL